MGNWVGPSSQNLQFVSLFIYLPVDFIFVLKSVHFKKTVAGSSFLSTLWYFFYLYWKYQNFERIEIRATVFLKWTDFRKHGLFFKFRGLDFRKQFLDTFYNNLIRRHILNAHYHCILDSRYHIWIRLIFSQCRCLDSPLSWNSLV